MLKKIKLLFLLNSLYPKGGLTMKNWRTTVSGLIMALSTILPHFGIAADLSVAIQTVATAVFAVLVKDASVSGTGL